MREGLHSFLLGALVEGKRFCHVRWVMADPAVATLLGLKQVRGEDALPRLGRKLDRTGLREWMNRPQAELYAALPDRFIADWDSTVVSERLKADRRGRIKTGYFEGGIALGAAEAAQRRDESTQNELTTVHHHVMAARLVVPEDCAGTATAPGNGLQICPAA